MKSKIEDSNSLAVSHLRSSIFDLQNLCVLRVLCGLNVSQNPRAARPDVAATFHVIESVTAQGDARRFTIYAISG